MNSIVPRNKGLVLALVSGFIVGLLFVFITSILAISAPFVIFAPIIIPLIFAACVLLFSVSFFARRPILLQSAKFAMIGTLNTLLDISILNTLILFFGFTAGIYFAFFKTISFLLAVTNSYLWNRFWTFEKPWGLLKKEYVVFITMTVFGLMINVGTASFVVDIIGPQFGLSEILWANAAAVVAALIAMTWNFSCYKFLVFSQKDMGVVSKQSKRKARNKEVVLAFVQEKKEIKNDDVEKLLDVSDSTAERYLNELEKEGKIAQHGTIGQGVYYTPK